MFFNFKNSPKCSNLIKKKLRKKLECYIRILKF
jgi:hypothetical protein